MDIIQSRFNQKYIFFITAGFVATFLISLALLQLFAALLFFGWLFEKNKSKGINIPVLIVLAFGFVRIISIIFSKHFDSSIVAVQKELLFYTTLVALSFYIKTFSRNDIIRLIEIFIHSGAIVALIGIILFSLGKVHRAQSFGSGYATFSTYLVVVLMFILSFHSYFKSREKLILWIAETSLIISGIILAMGRADIAIAILIGLIIIFFRKVTIGKLSITFFVAFVITFTALQLNSEESQKRVADPTTLSDRDILYEGFFDLALEHPLFGFGPRTFHDIFPHKEKLADKKVGSWHNDFVQTYLESGIFALILLLFLIYTVFAKANWVIFKPKRMITIEPEKFAAIFGFIAVLLSGLTGVFLYSPIISLLFAFLISLFSYFFYLNEVF